MLSVRFLAACCVVAAASAIDVCEGSSKNIDAAECTAWVSLYDGTGGLTQWANCGSKRLDPCGCRYNDSIYQPPRERGVFCPDGKHILQL
jgi:hypothetical protein